MNEPIDFLLWVRGTAFDVALTLFVIGVLLRLFEIYSLGRKPNLAEPKGSEVGPGFRTMFTRSLPEPGSFARQPLTVILGYLFHLGLFIAIFFFAPHIELFHNTFGVRWPGLPSPLVDAASVITILALLGVLWHRLTSPVKRLLSDHDDWLSWLLTFLPMLTGYLAFHRAIDPYPLVLGLHILSVEALLILFPFTKLMHAFTLFAARWYNGAMNGRRGVES